MRFARMPVEEASLGMTPLIDVVLLLLIFFLVTTTFADRQLELDLPDAEGAAATEADWLTVEIAPDGGLAFDGAAGDLAALRLRLEGGERPDGIEIRADRAADHGAVVDVLSLSRSLGLEQVGIAVDPGGALPGAGPSGLEAAQ